MNIRIRSLLAAIACTIACVVAAFAPASSAAEGVSRGLSQNSGVISPITSSSNNKTTVDLSAAWSRGESGTVGIDANISISGGGYILLSLERIAHSSGCGACRGGVYRGFRSCRYP